MNTETHVCPTCSDEKVLLMRDKFNNFVNEIMAENEDAARAVLDHFIMKSLFLHMEYMTAMMERENCENLQ